MSSSSSKFAAKSVINSDGIFEVHGPELHAKIDERGCGPIIFDKLNEYSTNILQIYAPTGEKETFGQAKIRAIRVALGLKQRGIKPQDVVCLCAFNALNPTIILIATQLIGATMASLDPTQSVIDMTFLLGVVKPKIIFIGKEAEANVKQAVKNSKLSIEIVVFDSNFDNKTDNDNLITPFTNFLKENHEEESKFKPQVCKGDDVAFIMFSSGTTGPPKGLCITHHGILYAAESFYAIGSDVSTVLHFSSYYWITAVLLSLVVILKGGKRILSPKIDENVFMKIVHDYKVTYCFLPPPMIYKITEELINKYDTRNLQSLIFGGGPVASEQLKKVRKLLPYTQVTVAYGMTEVSGYLTGYHHKNDYGLLNTKRRLTTCGYPAPGIIMQIIDPETGKALGPNQKGEIRIKCNSSFKNYINASSEDAFDENGLIKSGDIGYFDEENFLFIVDRIKEMFKYQSWHVVPTSLEAILYQHPAVNEAVVIGIPHKEDGDHPAAIVVLKNGAQATAEEIEKFVEERVNNWHKLRGGVKFASYILKTPSGKPSRRIMKEMFLKNESW